MIVAAIQARMDSSRLPGKVMMPICGKPILQHVVERVAKSNVEHVAILTGNQPIDNPVVELAERLGVECYRGSESDVLDRYFHYALSTPRLEIGDTILRITGDSPLMDPTVINKVIDRAIMQPYLDYICNARPKRTYPRGLDVELMPVDTLYRLHRIGGSGKAHEHVTWMIKQRPDLFCCGLVEDIENNGDLRWCVDTKTDLDVVRRLMETGITDYRSLVSYARSHPECRLNADVEQKDA